MTANAAHLTGATVGSHVGGPVRRRRKLAGFAVANGLVFSSVLLAWLLHPRLGAGLAPYVLLLGFCCSLPLLFVRSLHGRGSLLLVFQGLFFILFGLGDVAKMLSGDSLRRPLDSFLTGGEVAILLTSVLFTLGYAAVAGLAPRQVRGWMARDWSPRAITLFSIVAWVVGLILTAMFMSGVDFTRAMSTGLAAFGSLGGVAMLFSYLMPLADLCLIYLFLVKRSRIALWLLLVMLTCEFAYGFLVSSKEIAFRGPVLLALGTFFLRDRIPVKELILGAVLAAATFSYFQDMRTLVVRHGIQVGETVERLSERPQRAFGSDNQFSSRLDRGLEYLAGRGDLKGNVEMIVARTGVDVPYQEGYTLALLGYAFIPRFIAPDKPTSTTGLLVNKEFGVSAVSTVFISTSLNGDLYWNFGWTGLVAGMLLMGALMGGVNVLFDLSQRMTLPRFLVLMVTVYLIAVRFETNIALAFTLWLRTLALIGVLHLLMPKARESARGVSSP
jgi:hypothetical protein